jgi:serine/threonine-protein kinase HipA
MASKEIFVYADWDTLNIPTLMGILRAELVRGNEIFSFEYNKEWLKLNDSLILDPDLYLYSGPQFVPNDKINFGLFLDSSPDRWGRVLMRRREAALAKMGKRPQRNLFPSDYLLGVFDEHRMGALRFKVQPDGPYLNDNREMAAPPWSSIRDLEYASLKLETDDSVDNSEYLNWLNLLIAPGSSLGGARPKASVMDQNKHLWIAKFPSISDSVDVGGWEMVVYELAVMCGISMPNAMIQKFSGNHYTFLTKRFDRTGENNRIHFASAMTLLGRKDGDDYQIGVSYLDLVGFILQHGDKSRVNADLMELWKRIVFSICVKNTDDHLRNHGFLLGKNGWRLSPAYDINPIPTGTGLTLNISEDDNSLDLELALEVADYFRIEKERAKQIAQNIKKTVANWRKVSLKYGLPRGEQELMSASFIQID